MTHGHLYGLYPALSIGRSTAQSVGHHIQPLTTIVLRVRPLHMHAREAAGLQPLLHLLSSATGRHFYRKRHHQAPALLTLYASHPIINH
jgi:hypothetical protein